MIPAQTNLLLGPATEPVQQSASIRWEDDLFGGADRYYSDGISVAFAATGPGWLDPLADWLTDEATRRTAGLEFGQYIFTPSDITRPIPDPADHPYSGQLYGAVSLHLERDQVYHGLKFTVGVVGPWALAEDTQNYVHRVLDNRLAAGWHYQLHNEIIVNFTYEQRRKYRLLGRADGWAVEALPFGNVMLGNALTQGQLGAQLRFGYNIADDFGSTVMRGMAHLPPPRQKVGRTGAGWGCWFHAGASANLVGHDISLDGNTFRDSPSVDRKLFLPMWQVGVGIGNRHVQTEFAFVGWGQQFTGQAHRSQFGALSLSYFF